MKRKILSLLLCAAMVTTILGGCAAGNQTTSSEESTNTTQSTQTEDSAPESEEVTVKTATTDDVKAALEDENSIVLDARISDAYNGWQIDGAARGGHIKGAESFSADWATPAPQVSPVTIFPITAPSFLWKSMPATPPRPGTPWWAWTTT